MAGSPIPRTDYRDFGKKLLGNNLRRFPYKGTIEVTSRCNLKCVHCYIAHCQHTSELLSSKEIAGIIDDIAAKGCLWLLFTGGEPFLRPDFMDIYTYAKKKGILVTLFTNGTLITPAIADYLFEWKPRGIEITLYGATKDTYEMVTGVAGSFEKCIRGIELLIERHIPLRLKTMALTINQHEIGQMQEYAEKLGLGFKFDPCITPRIDKGLQSCEYRLTPEQVVDLELSFPKRVQEWQGFCQFHLGSYQGDSRYICGGGRNSFFIDAYGNLSICISSRSQVYDLRHGNFSQAWNEFLPRIINQKVKTGFKCRSCEFLGVCGRCPAWSELETGNPDMEIDWLCRLARLRLSAFGIDPPVSIKKEASQTPPSAL